ncbi:MAG: phosphohistidine phosphatase SixA [Deltaproteobacteria bacterium]|nr:phosphohistidine phosphatase SixA [Deltaproteobacteria bacterium]
MQYLRAVLMNFYLVRHGEAKAANEDPTRPLTDCGRKEVEKVARAVAAKEPEVFEILHSDKLRAKQTAEILAQSLSPRGGVREIIGLSPEDDPQVARVELEVAEAPLMLVGHLPHLSRLASMLVTGDTEKEIVGFPAAAILCLSRTEGGWEVRWTLVPEAV